MKWWIPPILLGMAFGLVCAAQNHPAKSTRPTAPAAAAKLYSIAGTVVDSVTNDPVPRATVSLLDEETRAVTESAQTGENGQFTLPPVTAGKYGLRAARRGYITAFFNEHEEFSSAIVTGEEQDTTRIRFQLEPDASLRGTVTDDAGEPVAQAQVLLMRQSHSDGRGEHLVKAISGVTDDRGEFEFWNLQPGTSYLLAVKATPWFALHPPQPQSVREEQGQAATALDVAYPVTYYDGVTEETAATPILAHAGEQQELNVTLHPVPALRLIVHTGETEAAGRRYISMPLLQQTVLSDEETLAPSVRPGPPGSGWVELSGLAPGHYSLLQGEPPRVNEIDASGTGSVDVDMAAGTPTARVTVAPRTADGSPLPQDLEMELVPDVLTKPRLLAREQGGRLQFDAVRPGAWTLVAQSEGQALAVIALQSATGTRAGSRFEVRNRPLALTAVLQQGSIQVQGVAQKDGKGLPGIMIVLVPERSEADWPLFRRDQSDSDGSFNLRDVVPGRYTIVAIENGWELDWARPEVIGRYLPRGITVTLNSQSGKLVRLPAPVAVQMR